MRPPKGASVEASGPSGATPLVVARRSNHEELVELLIAHGADADAYEKELADPALFARKYGYKALAKAMVDYSIEQATQGMPGDPAPDPEEWKREAKKAEREAKRKSNSFSVLSRSRSGTWAQ